MNKPAPELIALQAERAELMAKNAAATSWGAAVGARSERIKEIDGRIATLSVPLPPVKPDDGAVREALGWLIDAVVQEVVFTEITPLLKRRVEDACAALGREDKIGAAETSPGEALGRFGHHPDPAIDFCIEVEFLENEWSNVKANFTNGTPSREEITDRVFRAMQFRVGGDEGAVNAKAGLRKVEAEMSEPKSQEPDAVAVGYCCDGCGRLMQNSDEDMRTLRVAGFLSCCPERRLRPVYTTKPEAQAVSVDAIRAALEPLARIARLLDEDREQPGHDDEVLFKLPGYKSVAITIGDCRKATAISALFAGGR